MNPVKYELGEEWCPSGMLRRVALVRTDVLEELRTSLIRAKGG
jgi:hypothetical protein